MKQNELKKSGEMELQEKQREEISREEVHLIRQQAISQYVFEFI